MPYFSNKPDDETVAQSTRAGGEQLANALARLYEMIGHFEQDRTDRGRESLEAARKKLDLAVNHFSEATRSARRLPVHLDAGTLAEATWLEEPFAWLDRRGIAPDTITDHELFRTTVDSLALLAQALSRFAETSGPPGFQAVNAIVRAAIDVQLLVLGVTAMFEISRRSAAETSTIPG